MHYDAPAYGLLVVHTASLSYISLGKHGWPNSVGRSYRSTINRSTTSVRRTLLTLTLLSARRYEAGVRVGDKLLSVNGELCAPRSKRHPACVAGGPPSPLAGLLVALRS